MIEKMRQEWSETHWNALPNVLTTFKGVVYTLVIIFSVLNSIVPIGTFRAGYQAVPVPVSGAFAGIDMLFGFIALMLLLYEIKQHSQTRQRWARIFRIGFNVLFIPVVIAGYVLAERAASPLLKLGFRLDPNPIGIGLYLIFILVGLIVLAVHFKTRNVAIGQQSAS